MQNTDGGSLSTFLKLLAYAAQIAAVGVEHLDSEAKPNSPATGNNMGIDGIHDFVHSGASKI